jgi:hypothetical protein
MDYLVSINEIYDKTGRIIRRNEQLRQECIGLREENEQLHLKLKGHELQVQELENNLKLLKLAKQISGSSNGNGEEKTELKKKINEFIKEIDKCVALLNN